MPTIVEPSPLAAASDFAQGYAQSKDLALQRNMEQSKEKNDEQYRQQVLALQTRQADESQRVDEASIQSQQLHDSIDQDTANWTKQMRPLQEQLIKAQVTGANTQNALQNMQLAASKIDLEIKKKYGPQEAQLAIKQLQQQMIQSTQEIAQGWARVHNEQAQTGIESQRLGIEAGEARSQEGLESAETGEAKARTKALQLGGGLTGEQRYHNAEDTRDTNDMVAGGQAIIDDYRAQGKTDAQIIQGIMAQKFPEPVKARLIEYVNKSKGKPPQATNPQPFGIPLPSSASLPWMVTPP